MHKQCAKPGPGAETETETVSDETRGQKKRKRKRNKRQGESANGSDGAVGANVDGVAARPERETQ
tara:strand:+ start:2848 stop:3042 length:195 start_codon:yes stop_codon:yes gene_type:complete